MSHLRDQFVGNADAQSTHWNSNNSNTSRENLGYTHPTPRLDFTSRTTPYSPIENTPPRLDSMNMEPSYDDLRQGNHRSDLNRSSELYELSDIRKNPFETNEAPANPFQNSTYPNNYGYSVVPEQNQVPANFGNTVHEEQNPLEKLIRRNERNRRKLATRHPRFHYTNLPWFSILATIAQVAVFIAELVKMGIYTGSPFQSKPYFNPMIGPSTYVLINMGARYVPCMHKITGITLDLTIQFPCPNSTSIDTNVCNLNELCGLSGIPIIDNEFVPSQYYRLVIPIFLHAGILHIFFNMMLQLTMGVAVEKSIGWLKYSIIYMSSGVSGFLLGANFSPNGIASTGASGSLFGIISANFLLFVYCGTKNTNIYQTKRYKTFILIMIMEIIVCFVLGLLPGLDNFSHIGGFVMGILISIFLLPDPSFVYVDGIYTYYPDTPTWKLFLESWNPLNKYKDKVPWKMAVWMVVRLACLALAIVYFVLLTRNLKSKQEEANEETCSWCKYFNCLPVNGWCDLGDLTITTSPGSGTTGTPTNTNPGSQSTTAPIFNPPSAKRNVFENAPIRAHNVMPNLTLGAKMAAANIMPDLAAVALVAVVAYAGYQAVKKIKSKFSEKRLRRKERKLHKTL